MQAVTEKRTSVATFQLNKTTVSNDPHYSCVTATTSSEKTLNSCNQRIEAVLCSPTRWCCSTITDTPANLGTVDSTNSSTTHLIDHVTGKCLDCSKTCIQ